MAKMDRTEKLIRALARAGLTEFKAVKLTEERRGLMVYHNYPGLYPSAEALEKSAAVQRVAARLGMEAEQRGNRTATLIYIV